MSALEVLCLYEVAYLLPLAEVVAVAQTGQQLFSALRIVLEAEIHHSCCEAQWRHLERLADQHLADVRYEEDLCDMAAYEDCYCWMDGSGD